MFACNPKAITECMEGVHKYLCSVRHFELDEVFSMHDRGKVCKVLSNEFPALAVSVHWGTDLMGNQIAKNLGSFHFHKV